MVEVFSKSPLGILCSEFTKELTNHPLSGMFRKPVVDENYLSKIKNPMDLDTIRKKIKDNVYTSHKEWMADVNLIFDNAVEYNTAETIPGEIAIYLKKKASKMFKQFDLFNLQNYEERIRELYREIARVTEQITNQQIRNVPKYDLSELSKILNQLQDTTEVEKIIKNGGDQRVLKKNKEGLVNLDSLSRKSLDELWLKYGPQ
ncbi:Bromodomain containing protein [Histomonas meleagridis]|uniref:Bromodomain containing protein n=1 Tax=Histomonas meleagridis TaxID=135588 RepID=UPI003559B6C6|nr:Bromodomain containing protein [Histomonas meleagridis]KAH0803962.1 Bromodomain containing protein [Histomonas meleagridis]